MPVVQDWTGQEIGEASLELKVAKEASAKDIVHRALIRQLNNARQGTASAKTRSEVRGGGRKPWRQKGTGRARAGSSRSPLWRGGGVIFGPKPRDFDIKMNRKERRLALRTALYSRLEDIIVVEDFAAHLPQPKTKELAQALGRWGASQEEKVLLIIEQKQESVCLSARNMPNLVLITADQLNVFDIVTAQKLVITAPALEKIQSIYGNKTQEDSPALDTTTPSAATSVSVESETKTTESEAETTEAEMEVKKIKASSKAKAETED